MGRMLKKNKYIKISPLERHHIEMMRLSGSPGISYPGFKSLANLSVKECRAVLQDENLPEKVRKSVIKYLYTEKLNADEWKIKIYVGNID